MLPSLRGPEKYGLSGLLLVESDIETNQLHHVHEDDVAISAGEAQKRLEKLVGYEVLKSPIVMEVEPSALRDWVESLVNISFESVARELIFNRGLYRKEEGFISDSEIVARITTALSEEVVRLADGRSVTLSEVLYGDTLAGAYLLYLGFHSVLREAVIENPNLSEYKEEQLEALARAAWQLGISITGDEEIHQYYEMRDRINNCTWLFLWLYQHAKNKPSNLTDMIEKKLFDIETIRYYDVFCKYAAVILAIAGDVYSFVPLAGTADVNPTADDWVVDEDIEWVKDTLRSDPTRLLYFFLSIMSDNTLEALRESLREILKRVSIPSNELFYAWLTSGVGTRDENI